MSCCAASESELDLGLFPGTMMDFFQVVSVVKFSAHYKGSFLAGESIFGQTGIFVKNKLIQ